jgi:salicylate hydroxylase
MIQNVAIVGAGLGGCSVAIALNRQGVNAQVYEKARELRPIGAGLSLFPNGLKALDKITAGITELLKDLGSQAQKVNIRKSNGELIAQNSLTLMEKYQQPMLNIRWSCLQETLFATLSPDVVHLNHRCIGFDQTDNDVKISFDNGKTVVADFLIGADGINSIIRQQLIGDGSPHYAGRLSWRAVIPYQHEQLSPNEVTIMTGTEGKIFTLIDVGNGYIFWSAGMLSTENIMSESAATAKERLLEIYAGWSNPVEAIVEATPANDIIERPIYDRPTLNSWSNGRVTLLGDAAHPMVPSLGQGANTAFEDAWELSQFLIHQPTIEAALRSYEKSRIYRTQIIQARSAFQGSRSYEADSETFLSGVAAQARANQADFEDWLYNYNLSAIS